MQRSTARTPGCKSHFGSDTRHKLHHTDHTASHCITLHHTDHTDDHRRPFAQPARQDQGKLEGEVDGVQVFYFVCFYHITQGAGFLFVFSSSSDITQGAGA